MSVISNLSQNKKLALWKVSDQTKTNNKEFTVINATYQLPERFSPAKKGHNQSRLLNSSMEKLKLSRFQSKKERSPTPKSNQRVSILGQGHANQRSSTFIHPNTPKKQQKFPTINMNSRDSCFSLNSEQVRNISNEGISNFMQKHENNRKMILQLKEEFLMFRKTVIEQMYLQRKMVQEFITKIQQTCNKSDIKQINLQSYVDVTKKAVEIKADEQTNNLLTFQSLVENVQQSIKNITPGIEGNFDCSQNKLQSLILPKRQNMIIKDEIINKSEQSIKQSNSHQQSKQLQTSKRNSPHLYKCNQIAQTINILNQINAFPVSTPRNSKSTQKQMIQQYKQKILAVTKSNDNLIKQKTRKSLLRAEQQNKVKGNFKLQKFYNAIQKLKEEVNEIKSINQPKSSKIIK